MLDIINNLNLIKSAGKSNEVYPQLVDYLIRQKYSVSRVEAIINNYLDEPNEKHTLEFQELQAFRKSCKQQAKEMLDIKD